MVKAPDGIVGSVSVLKRYKRDSEDGAENTLLRKFEVRVCLSRSMRGQRLFASRTNGVGAAMLAQTN